MSLKKCLKQLESPKTWTSWSSYGYNMDQPWVLPGCQSFDHQKPTAPRTPLEIECWENVCQSGFNAQLWNPSDTNYKTCGFSVLSSAESPGTEPKPCSRDPLKQMDTGKLGQAFKAKQRLVEVENPRKRRIISIISYRSSKKVIQQKTY